MNLAWKGNVCRDLFSQTMGKPLSILLWDTELERTKSWYPNTWLAIANSTATTAVYFDSKISVATVSTPSNDVPANWKAVADPELHVCTHPPKTIGENTDEEGHSGVWSELENLPCKSANYGEWELEVFLGTCIQLQQHDEVAASLTLTSISSFSTSWQKEATIARAVSALSASAGGAVNAGVSAAVGQVAAAAGESTNDGCKVKHIIQFLCSLLDAVELHAFALTCSSLQLHAKEARICNILLKHVALNLYL
jgi:hypothetical protein